MTVDLTTTYLGMTLAHPLVPSASPLSGNPDALHRLVEAGAAAVVLPSLFEEQVEHEELALHEALEYGSEIFPEAAGGYFPEMDRYNTGPQRYLELIRTAKDELTVPVIASLNGTTTGGWTLYAKILADQGIDALELNVYRVAADVNVAGVDIELEYLHLVEQIRGEVSVPLAVKVGPFFSSTANMARRLTEAGANALVLFNRFYQPDIDLDRLEVVPNLKLSDSDELRLVLRWIAILHGRVDASLAATTGVHTADDVVKLILAGADVTMMASALLRNGPEHLGMVLDQMRSWFNERGYGSLAQAKGSLSQRNAPDPAAFERSNYMKALVEYSSTWPMEQR